MLCPDDAILQDFMDGRASASTTATVRSHLRSCPQCRAVVRELSESSRTEVIDAPFAGLDREASLGAIVAERFRLERWLGEGAMGVVWHAHDLQEDRPVALKLLRIHDVTLARRFAREGRFLVALRHPNIVRVFDARAGAAEGKMGEDAWVATELLHGTNLDQRLSCTGVLSEAETVGLARATLEGLAYAHGAGVIHRDIKPHNIFLEDAPTGAKVKLIDFGLAKASRTWHTRASTLTRTGVVVGTPRYMAPEQLFEDPNADHRVDLWSLGVVMYRCLSGAMPHEAKSLGELVRVFSSSALIPLRRAAPGLASGLLDFVEHLMDPTPERRPADARAALAELSPLVESLGEAPLATHG